MPKEPVKDTTDQIAAEAEQKRKDEAFENIVTALGQCQKGTARQFFNDYINAALSQRPTPTTVAAWRMIKDPNDETPTAWGIEKNGKAFIRQLTERQASFIICAYIESTATPATWTGEKLREAWLQLEGEGNLDVGWNEPEAWEKLAKLINATQRRYRQRTDITRPYQFRSHAGDNRG